MSTLPGTGLGRFRLPWDCLGTVRDNLVRTVYPSKKTCSIEGLGRVWTEPLDRNGKSDENSTILGPVGVRLDRVLQSAAGVGCQQRNDPAADPGAGSAGSDDAHAAVV